MTELKVYVVSDAFPDMPIEVCKNDTELPNKYFVDYEAKMRTEHGSGEALHKDPYAAYRYDSLEAYKEKKQPRVVVMTDSMVQNGFRPQRNPSDPPMLICFILDNQAG